MLFMIPPHLGSYLERESVSAISTLIEFGRLLFRCVDMTHGRCFRKNLRTTQRLLSPVQ
jgi:hypothetical protein